MLEGTYSCICVLCENRLQWPKRQGLYAGVISHYGTVHPRAALTLSEYSPQ